MTILLPENTFDNFFSYNICPQYLLSIPPWVSYVLNYMLSLLFDLCRVLKHYTSIPYYDVLIFFYYFKLPVLAAAPDSLLRLLYCQFPTFLEIL